MGKNHKTPTFDQVINPSSLRQVWEGIHQIKASSGQQEKGLVSFAEQMQKQLPVDAPVLDLGCGRGRNTRFLSQLGFEMHGCDWSYSALNVAKSHSQPGPLALFSVADLTRLPYSSNSFAAVVCVHVLPYLVLANIRQAVKEMWRVLRHGGWLYVDLLDKADPEYGRGPKLEPYTYLDEDGVPTHFSSQSEVKALFTDFHIQRQTRHELGRRIIWEIWAQKEPETSSFGKRTDG